MLKNFRLFVGEFTRNLKTVGAVAPSSKALAKAMLRPMADRPARPIRVLEVGPGTGAFTRQLLQKLQPADSLDLIELNPSFCRHLEVLLKRKDWSRPGVQVQLHQLDVRQFKEKRPYDYILSGLPFANFDAQTVSEILTSYLERLTPAGVLSFFEYSLPNMLRYMVLKRSEHPRLREVIQTVQTYQRKHAAGSTWVWKNLPPAHARHLQKKAHH